MAIVIHGIRNCDTMKRARAWLDARGIDYRFHDYKTAGITPETLRDWAGQVGWEALLNRAGTTFRKLPEAEKAGLDETRALALLAAHPSAIKRPVLDHDGALLVGFSPEKYAEAFG
ncbi:MAG: ArsC family reductase [Amaricoccus sp.]|uniref:ArsC family reductase n=1 Tax=Amaricoccus sp. TaxID=1872485 RepID=UPI0033147049